jgi:hypothetical protein
MDKFNNISDEKLACFIEGTLPEKEADEVWDSITTRNDLETIVIAFKAQRQKNNKMDLVFPDERDFRKTATMNGYERLLACGFLGDDDTEGTSPANEKTDITPVTKTKDGNKNA